MGAFQPIQPPPSVVPGPPPTPTSDRLAGKTSLQSPSPEQEAAGVQRETDALKTLIQGFAAQYPQAEQAAQTALNAIQAMAESVLATLEPPLGAAISPPPGLVG